jgi:hypothetical protein
MQLQYIGFTQTENTREYIFHGLVHGETTRVFVMSADMALFLKHRVGVQEGPVLCLRTLTAELGAQDQTQPPPLSLHRVITDHDMAVYMAAPGPYTSPKPGVKRPRLPGKEIVPR